MWIMAVTHNQSFLVEVLGDDKNDAPSDSAHNMPSSCNEYTFFFSHRKVSSDFCVVINLLDGHFLTTCTVICSGESFLQDITFDGLKAIDSRTTSIPPETPKSGKVCRTCACLQSFGVLFVTPSIFCEYINQGFFTTSKFEWTSSKTENHSVKMHTHTQQQFTRRLVQCVYRSFTRDRNMCFISGRRMSEAQSMKTPQDGPSAYTNSMCACFSRKFRRPYVQIQTLFVIFCFFKNHF